jgi:hypothetical protein
VRAAFLALVATLGLCTSCISYTYERDSAFEPVRESRVETLHVGESRIGDALASLGAPLYVWEGVDQAIVLAYGFHHHSGWGVRVSVPLEHTSASFSYDDAAARLEGYILVFDNDGTLRIVRGGLLRDLRNATRHPPAFVE